MAERGHGEVINVTTMVAEFGMAGTGLYRASKAALALLTKSWAADYGPHGVRVNAVSPGPVRTEGTAEMGDSLDQLAAADRRGAPGLLRRSPRPSSRSSMPAASPERGTRSPGR
jgi:NAD(P)-dependent dehydrogenase (short-subunit alcohol dehydrogenase family)